MLLFTRRLYPLNDLTWKHLIFTGKVFTGDANNYNIT